MSKFTIFMQSFCALEAEIESLHFSISRSDTKMLFKRFLKTLIASSRSICLVWEQAFSFLLSLAECFIRTSFLFANWKKLWHLLISLITESAHCPFIESETQRFNTWDRQYECVAISEHSDLMYCTAPFSGEVITAAPSVPIETQFFRSSPKDCAILTTTFPSTIPVILGSSPEMNSFASSWTLKKPRKYSAISLSLMILTMNDITFFPETSLVSSNMIE